MVGMAAMAIPVSLGRAVSTAARVTKDRAVSPAQPDHRGRKVRWVKKAIPARPARLQSRFRSVSM